MSTETLDRIKDQLKQITNPLQAGRNPSKIALCLAGGGITGSMYEVGCLKALDEFIGDDFSTSQVDIFVGVSAGAIISSLLANGYLPSEMYEGIAQNKKSTLNFRRKNIYNLRWSEIFRSVAPIFRRLPSLLKYAWTNRQHASFMDLLSILQEFVPAGLFSLNNLDKFVAALLYPEGKTNDFRNLNKELYIPATHLDTGKRWVFGDEYKGVPISKAVAASAAIPLFFRPFQIDGNDFIDGSTSQVSHLDIAIKHGARLIIIVNPTVPIDNDKVKLSLPTFDGQCGSLRQKGMGFISEQARRIETKTRFEFGLERFEKQHPDIDYIVIQPKSTDGILFFHGVMDFDSRAAILNYGYYTTMAELRTNFLKYKEIFDKHRVRVESQFH